MNNINIQHNTVQKQEPSWIDADFNIKKSFAGVARLSHQDKLDHFIQELVISYGIYCQDHYEIDIDCLTEEEQTELTRLYIESIDREIEWACYGLDETINSDFLCAMLAMLKDNNPKTRNQFAITTRKNLFVYYKLSLQNLIDIGCDVHYNNERNQEDMRSDYENGDISWDRD